MAAHACDPGYRAISQAQLVQGVVHACYEAQSALRQGLQRGWRAHSASAQGEIVSVTTIVNRLLEQLCNDPLYPDVSAGFIQWVTP